MLAVFGMRLDPEEIDLAELAATLDSQFSRPPLGYLEGRTVARDVVVDLLRCSELEAENIVETLVSRGFLRFHEEETGGLWRVDPRAA